MASRLKVALPGHHRSAFGSVHLHPLWDRRTEPAGSVVMGCAATLMQCFWHHRRAAQVASSAVQSSAASRSRSRPPAMSIHSNLLHKGHLDAALTLMVTATVFFVMNTFPVAAAIALTEQKSLRQVWRECYFWSFPYYLLGRGDRGCGQRHQPLLRLADRAAGHSGGLSDLPFLLPLSRPHGRRKEARRGDGVAALENHRSAGAGDRSQGSHHARSSAARASLRHRGGQGTGPG